MPRVPTPPEGPFAGSVATGPGGPPSSAESSVGVLMEPHQALVELARLIVGQTALGEVLAWVTQLGRASVPGAVELSVTLLDEEGAWTAASTSRVAAALDQRQYRTGFGPSLHAARTGQVVRIDDTDRGGVHAAWATVAASSGVRSVLTVGLPKRQGVAGGLTVYRFDRGLLTDDAVQVLRDFAGYTAAAVAARAPTGSPPAGADPLRRVDHPIGEHTVGAHGSREPAVGHHGGGRPGSGGTCGVDRALSLLVGSLRRSAAADPCVPGAGSVHADLAVASGNRAGASTRRLR